MSEDKTEYVYSHNEDDWHEDYRDAKDQAVDALFGTDYREATIYRGEKRKFNHSDFINADTIIETIRESADEEFGECSDGYLLEILADGTAELERLVVEFIESRVGPPSFYQVINVSEEKIYLTDDEING